jgi:hypothetical protein
MLSRRARIFLVLAGVAVAVGAVEGGYRLVERHRTMQELRGIRDQLYTARVSADSCRNELAYAERLFQRYDTLVDSLRRDVRRYEEAAGGRVPRERYDEYLKHFDAYNDSVASWHLKADSLQRRQTACRNLARAHNVLADSLRRRLLEEGIPTDSGGR